MVVLNDMNKNFVYILNYALKNGFQVNPDIVNVLDMLDINTIKNTIKKIIAEKTSRSEFIIGKKDFKKYLNSNEELMCRYEILFDPTKHGTSGEGINGYYSLFKNRFIKLKKIAKERPELKQIKTSLTSIKNTHIVYVYGLLLERKIEKKFTRLIMDDINSLREVLVFSENIKNIADKLFLDQFIIVKIKTSNCGNDVCKDIIVPDIPKHKHNKSETETCAVFLSDLHIGSKYFMEKELSSFIDWLTSDDHIAKKIRFIIIAGDLIDGVGVYPNQETELELKSIDKQIKKAVDVLVTIPKHIKIFIIPGNHDPGRKALPQPAISEKFKLLWNNENIILIGNPCLIAFNGVKILVYHGQSIDDIVSCTSGLNYKKPTDAMKMILRTRHMCPTYGSKTQLAPELDDMLVVDEIPDIFHTGHIHITDFNSYRGILLINSGTWQKQTPFQAAIGVVPTPGIAVIVNLKTFKVYLNSFIKS